MLIIAFIYASMMVMQMIFIQNKIELNWIVNYNVVDDLIRQTVRFIGVPEHTPGWKDRSKSHTDEAI
jgi:hypothetical protein